MKRISTAGVTSTFSVMYVVQPASIGKLFRFCSASSPDMFGWPSIIRIAIMECGVCGAFALGGASGLKICGGSEAKTRLIWYVGRTY